MPTYHALGDHTESVQIQYDPKQTTYADLLKIFWQNHDPSACLSRQYMSAIFYHNDNQKALAEETMQKESQNRKRPIQTKITEAERFYDAEDYHQKYLLRQQRGLFNSLELSKKEVLNSHIAARLNGYVGGYGSPNKFEKELPNLGLSVEQANYVNQLIGRGPMS
ncbi:peptide methionine sulfoxide reductase-like [Branchiostoma lanceolatum]|uniref:peptide methionine sulfoxide reductase-like n=1 Tax=Branchiostoma lanceolatum TaxID=7740 RepID=UPI003451E2B0